MKRRKTLIFPSVHTKEAKLKAEVEIDKLTITCGESWEAILQVLENNKCVEQYGRRVSRVRSRSSCKQGRILVADLSNWEQPNHFEKNEKTRRVYRS